jgi:hypothetical protein
MATKYRTRNENPSADYTDYIEKASERVVARPLGNAIRTLAQIISRLQRFHRDVLRDKNLRIFLSLTT